MQSAYVKQLPLGVSTGSRILILEGTTVSAIDLEAFVDGDDDGGDDPSGGGDDTDWPDEGDDSPVSCDYDKNPSSLQGLADHVDDFDPGCLTEFTLDVLYGDVAETLDLFDKKNMGYKSKFGYHVQWVKGTINSKLRDFIEPDGGEGFNYFNCKWKAGFKIECEGPCAGMPHVWDSQDILTSGTRMASTTLSSGGLVFQRIGSRLATLRMRLDAGNVDPGIAGDAGFPGAGNRGTGTPPSCQKRKHILENVPRKKNDKGIEVTNPKDIIEKAWSNLTN
ncbi:hypothetical protein PWT90_01911 [Aphanocladium album]|nr:hypothetical protein PWT90_01911 [Aphanocladium album]